jgi:hypothetical protein
MKCSPFAGPTLTSSARPASTQAASSMARNPGPRCSRNHVRRNVEDTKAHRRRIGTPKSKRGYRTFQIDQSLVKLLRLEKNRSLRLVAGTPDGVEVDLSC